MKKIYLILTIVVLAIAIFFLIRARPTSPKVTQEISPTPNIVLPTITSDIKVSLTARSDKKAVMLKIAGLTEDMLSIEYELTYVTASNLPRGVLGKIQLQKEKEIVRDDIVLGTCSSGRCVYDEGVTEVTLSLKFNNQQGQSIFRQSYPL